MKPTVSIPRHFLLIQSFVLAYAIAGVSVVCAQPGRGGGPNAPDQKIVKDFDEDKDGVLNKAERAKAKEFLESRSQGNRGGFGFPPPPRTGGRGPGDRGPGDRGPGGRFGQPGGRRGFGGPPGRGGNRPRGTEGPEVSASDVKSFPNGKLYDPDILRTVFIEFEDDNWESDLELFKPTDVELPAALTVDGKKYQDVGVSFRGASSFFSVPAGSKRSLNISMDYKDGKQKLYGYKTLNLLNCNGDATMMSSYLYAGIAGSKIATPKVNFVKVVINGRSWGIYANVEQFNKDFVEHNFGTTKGARWKVSGSPRGDAGLRYVGDDIEEYRAKYEIKSKDKEDSWKKLINLCKVLNETPADKLVSELGPILDIDGALWFLACDVALINSDGYWTRASDYSIYLDPKGKFHILPHDMNEAFRSSRGGRGPGGPGGGPGGPGGPGGFFRRPPNEGNPEPRRPNRADEKAESDRPNEGGKDGGKKADDTQSNVVQGYQLDPLTGLSDRFPLRQKLLAIPELKKKYFEYLRTIASEHIAWSHLGPKVKKAVELIGKEVEADTRKLASYEEFVNLTSESKPRSLQEFAEQRSMYLLQLPEIKNLDPKK